MHVVSTVRACVQVYSPFDQCLELAGLENAATSVLRFAIAACERRSPRCRCEAPVASGPRRRGGLTKLDIHRVLVHVEVRRRTKDKIKGEGLKGKSHAGNQQANVVMVASVAQISARAPDILLFFSPSLELSNARRQNARGLRSAANGTLHKKDIIICTYQFIGNLSESHSLRVHGV